MTGMDTAIAPGRPAKAPEPVRTRTARWQRAALAAICGLAAVLYCWAIGGSWGNSYYTAAVESMSQSFENFLFGAFDPAGVVTVDKPPMALWAQVISVKLLGYNQVAVLLPQAVAGVAAVFVLHRAVRRWAGENAALLAALVLATTPITVVINRDNNPDTLLVLLVVTAAWALGRAVEAERATRWLVLAAALVGCGFLTKMLQAWMVLPAFAAAYLVGRRESWVRRLAGLAVAAVTLVVSSFWWVVVTALWPSPKPYIGGSTDGSAWDLVFGYNGFGRILGGEGNGGSGGGGGPGGGGGFSGEAGPLRLFNDQLGGQISWLLPLCLLVLASVAVRAWRGRPVDRVRASGWVLWGGWLLVVGVMFSFAQGTMHPYYTTMLAPAVGAVAGAGLVRMWRWYREPGGFGWLLLPVAVAVTATWAVLLVARDQSWHPWVGWVAAVLGAVAVSALLLGRRRVAALVRPGLALALAAILAAPSAWAVIGAVSGQSGMGGANPTAGPTSMGGPPGGPGRGGGPMGGQPPGDAEQPADDGGQRRRGFPGGGPGGGDSLSEEQRRLLDYVVANAGGLPVPLAVEGGSHGAASYLINSDVAVVGMGGFMGSDDAPSTALLSQWKQAGQLGFVQLGGGPGDPGAGPGTPAGDGVQAQGVGDQAQGRADQDGPRGAGDRDGARAQRQEWVTRNCTPVDPAAYGGTADSGSDLYDCR
ncbi:glycosyltransferase family 39 protein [Saccharopolyspora erythraea]|uniref:ArnT family glycosyltransferase n=1 Tax=Saccharopolyspora erythraea TaxID=1836 RepID=UPI001BA8BE51|nr:glycosyltransferase family 39 protein [Saccharopolyspora erythraea]QUH04541.1 glycosyltransferase family 39 protein [Saccharopolyspora erythraea]